MANENDFELQLSAQLDEQSKANINSDISKLEKSIEKIKVQAELDPKSADNIANSLTRLLNQKITIDNIQVSSKAADTVGKQAGQVVGNSLNKSLSNVKLDISNIIKGFSSNKLNSFDISKMFNLNRGSIDSSVVEDVRKITNEINSLAVEILKTNSETSWDGLMDKISSLSSIIGKFGSSRNISSFKESLEVLDYFQGKKIYVGNTTDVLANTGKSVRELNNQFRGIGVTFTTVKEGATQLDKVWSELFKINPSFDQYASFGDQISAIVNQLSRAKGALFDDSNLMPLNGNEIASYLVSWLDSFEQVVNRVATLRAEQVEIEKNIAESSSASADTVVKNEEKKQKAYEKTYSKRDEAEKRSGRLSNAQDKFTTSENQVSKNYDVSNFTFGNSIDADKNAHEYFQKLLADENAIIYTTSKIGELGGLKEFTTHIKHASGELESLRFVLDDAVDGDSGEFIFSEATINDAGALKQVEKIEKEYSKYYNKLNDLKTKYSNASVDFSGFETKLQDFKNGTISVNELSMAFNDLSNSAKLGVQSLKSQKSSLDPIQQTLNNMRDTPAVLNTLDTEIGEIKDKTSLAGVSIEEFAARYQNLKSELESNGNKVPLTEEWTNAYKELMSDITAVIKQVDSLKKAEASDNSQITKQKEYYSTLKSNYEEIYALKKKLLTADEEETKAINDRLKTLNASNAGTWNQLNRQGLRDSDKDSDLNSVRDKLQSELDIASGKKKDKTNTEKENSAQRESVQIVNELATAWQKVQDIRVKIASLDENKNANEIANLQNEEANAKDDYQRLYNNRRKRKNYNKDTWNSRKSEITEDANTRIRNNASKQADNLSKTKDVQVGKLDSLKKEWQEQGILVGEFEAKVEKLEKALANVGSNSELDTLKNQLQELKAEASDIADIQDKFNVEGYSKEFSKIESQYKNIGKYSLNDSANTEILNKLNEAYPALEAAYAKFKESMAEDSSYSIEQKITLEKQYQEELLKTKNLLSQVNINKDDEILGVGSQERINMINTLNDFLAKNTAMGKGNEAEIRSWITTLSSATNMTKGEIRDISNNLNTLETKLRQDGKLGLSFGDKLKQAFQKFGGWTLVTKSFTKSTQYIRTAINEIKELDSVLTEVAKTSDLTDSQITELGKSSFEKASEYGKTAADYLNNVTEMYRAGFDNAEEMAELSLQAQAAGDLDSSASEDYLIATNAAYDFKGNVEELNDVLDRQNYITNNAAVSMQDIADATSEAASMASQYGVDVEDLSALIAVGVSKTRESGSEVGTALKALFVNLQDTTSTPIREAFEAVGISMTKLVDGSETLKTPIELLKELSVAFNSLPEGDTKRANILNDIGGKHHANTLAAILSDMESYNDMLNLYNSTSAEGSAFSEAEKSANNLEGTLNKISNTWTKTVDNVINSDDLTFLANVLNNILGIVEELTDKTGLFGTTLLTVTPLLTKKGLGLTNYVIHHSLRVLSYKIV